MADHDRVLALLEIRKSNPWPPIDRRWQLARYFAERGEPVPRALLDPWIRIAWHHLNRQDASLPPGQSELTHLVALREELQARLLSGQSNEQIAMRLQLQPEQVEVYERLFFAVRDRLSAPSYIRTMAVGSNTGSPMDQLGVFWREHAYFRGSAILNWMVDAFRSLPASLQHRGIAAYTDRRAECPPLLRLAARVRTMRITPRSVVSVCRSVLRELERIERWESHSALTSANQLSEILQTMDCSPTTTAAIPASATHTSSEPEATSSVHPKPSPLEKPTGKSKRPRKAA